MPFESAGNTLETANKLNFTNYQLTEVGWVGQQNSNDFYTLNLSTSSSLNLTLDGLDGDANINLLDADGSVITSSDNRNRRTERINTSLEAGDYYIQVYQNNNDETYYRLRISTNQAPHSLNFATDKISYQEGEDVLVSQVSVFDADGIQDFAKVDLKLQKDNGYWQDIDDIYELDIHNSTNNSYTSDYAIAGLTEGEYKLQGIAYDQLGATTNTYNVDFEVLPSPAITSPIPTTQDWFDEHIKDTETRNLVKDKFVDNTLDRQDVITILRSTEDDNVIDANEFADLQIILEASSYLGIPEYVKVLANKVVHGDYANRNYQSNSLGNLYIGSSGPHMESLINKWFYGGDRPANNYTYQESQGSLFVDGVSYLDVKQGIINDCFFLASLSATALRTPNVIESMFIDNGDGTFTVRFWRNGVADYVTVDRYLPTNSNGNFVYANQGLYSQAYQNELWVALAEKAYAQINESGWINQNSSNSYDGIGNGGYISDALGHITGNSSYLGNSLNMESIVNSFQSGNLLAFATKSTGVADNIVAGHAYTLIAYDGSKQTFHLFNPWGNKSASEPGLIELTWSEIEASFSYWDYAEVNSQYV
ncbi:MAG: C2 family cysteine protease [Cyanobacteria bacterium P01_A01_bin.45]